jgi:endonuclease G
MSPNKAITLLTALVLFVGAWFIHPQHTYEQHPQSQSQHYQQRGWEGNHSEQGERHESRAEANHAYRVEDSPGKEPAPLDETGGHPEHRDLQHLVKDGYTVEYDNELKGPAKVQYSLNWETRSNEKLRRPQTPFATDEETGAKVTTQNYAGSGYDRGHMCPSFAMGAFHGRNAQIGTFICSNILPQTHLCNAGVWNSIERMESDDFAKRFGEVTITDGPIYNKHPEEIKNHIAVPAAFYKIIERPDHKLLVFLVPQIPKSTKPEDYLSNLQHIRDLTGLNLLPTEPTEEASTTRTKIW